MIYAKILKCPLNKIEKKKEIWENEALCYGYGELNLISFVQEKVCVCVRMRGGEACKEAKREDII